MMSNDYRGLVRVPRLKELDDDDVRVVDLTARNEDEAAAVLGRHGEVLAVWIRKDPPSWFKEPPDVFIVSSYLERRRLDSKGLPAPPLGPRG